MDTQNTKPEFNLSLFKIALGTHRDKKVIWLRFDYNKSLIEMLQQHIKAHWSQSQKAWYVVDNLHNRNLCGIQPNIVGKDVLCKISVANLPEFQKYQNILTLKGFSPILFVLIPLSLPNCCTYSKISPCKNFHPKDCKAISYIVLKN